MKKTPEAEPVPRRGRRPHTAEESERVRTQIIDAAAEVFAEHGFHGMTVELVVKAAGLARPTFYRYFDNVGQVAEAVFERNDQGLLTAVLQAYAEVEGLTEKTLAAVDAYLDWARGRGPLLKALYAELHDPTSPVSRHRAGVQEVLAEAMRQEIIAAGRVPPSDFDLDLALNTVTYAGFRLNLAEDVDPVALETGRESVSRIVIALLGLVEEAQPAASKAASSASR